MNQRNKKRLVAQWVLGELYNHKPCIQYVGNYEDGVMTEVNKKHYGELSIKELSLKGKHDRDAIRDAAELLKKNEHVSISDNPVDFYMSLVRINDNGRSAYQDNEYLDDIEKYKI